MEIRNNVDRGGDIMITKYYDGINFPPNVKGNVKDQLDALQNLKHKDGDVLIDTYPKSGTHWTYEIVQMLQRGKADYSINPSMCLEFESIDELDSLDEPRTLKSHLYPKYIPKSVIDEKCKIIYIYRNPKDVSVSMHSFMKRINIGEWKGYKGTWENFFELYATKPLAYNTWFQHVKSWLDFKKTNPDLPILIMSYENMKADLRGCVQKMAEHLGAKQDPEFLDEVANKCQFSVMSKAQSSNKKETSMSKDGSNPFYRKGDVGDWKNSLTVAQSEMYDAVIEEKMTGIDLEIKYTL